MSDTSTRSGMLWEVERILDECKELNQLPQILLMENVPQVHGEGAKEDFVKWQLKLESLGYKSYWQDLIATDYGIPQTRNRCFMVSILGDYSYAFPQPIPLNLKLKDLLEKEVDEKYYLNEKQIQDISKWNAYEKPLEHINDEIRGTLTTRSGAYCSGMQLVGIKVPEATKQGYAIAKDGDGIYINRPHQKRGVVQKGKIQTLKTSCEDVGVVVKGITTTESQKWQKEPLKNLSRIILANKSNGGVDCIENDLRIRKLTPKECGRLMGVKDEDIDKMFKNQSNASMYHLFGDSIEITCLTSIFGEMLDIDYWNRLKDFDGWWNN